MNADRLYELARGQAGVFARWQATDIGFSHEAIARRLSSKEWIRVAGPVLASAAASLGPESLEWVAYLACGRESILSGPSAVRRHGLDVDARSDGVRWVTIPPERHVTISSVRTIREAVAATDVIVLGGMRVTTIEKSIVDTLRVVPDYVGRPILDRALQKGWLTTENLEERTIALCGRRGVGRLRDHAARVRTGARSEAERLLHQIIAEIPGWEANYEIIDDLGQLVAVLDVAFAKQRLAIEIDGLAFHTSPDRFQRDRTKQNRLVGMGWRILRFTWDDLTMRPAQVRQQILHELARQDPTER